MTTIMMLLTFSIGFFVGCNTVLLGSILAMSGRMLKRKRYLEAVEQRKIKKTLTGG